MSPSSMSAKQLPPSRESAPWQRKEDAQTGETLQVGSDLAHLEPHNQVFGTTEILESILEFLPPKELVVIQRVNKHFREILANSPRI